MFQISLPTLKQELKDGVLIETEGEIIVNIDTSLAAEIRYEEAFPKLAETTSLFAYLERCGKIVDTSTAITWLKGLYPFIDFQQSTSFVNFCKMFNFGNPDFFKKFVSKIYAAFELINPTSKKND